MQAPWLPRQSLWAHDEPSVVGSADRVLRSLLHVWLLQLFLLLFCTVLRAASKVFASAPIGRQRNPLYDNHAGNEYGRISLVNISLTFFFYVFGSVVFGSTLGL